MVAEQECGVCAADHDDRVVPLHSYKMIATLQHTLAGYPDSPQRNPLLLRVDHNAGHGGGERIACRLIASPPARACLAALLRQRAVSGAALTRATARCSQGCAQALGSCMSGPGAPVSRPQNSLLNSTSISRVSR